jgi:hypothetical protein
MVKKVGAWGLIFLLLWIPSLAFAQAPLTLPAVEVDLWPEYDDPGMLVIYRVTLPSTTSLPATINLRIPAAAGKPNAVASKQPDGSLVNLNYQQKTNGQWNVLAITATSPEVQVEYYDPSLKKEDKHRTFTFEWPGDYAVDALTLQVQRPFDASPVQFSPDDFGVGQPAGDGLTYYNENIGPVPAGPPFKIQLSYDKPTDDLTIKHLDLQSSGAAKTNASSFETFLPWILGVLGVGLIVGGLVWYFSVGRGKTVSKNENRARHKRTAQKAGVVPTAEEYVYCSRCGKRAASGDRFCRTCGAELRR